MNSKTNRIYDYLKTPLGWLEIAASDGNLRHILFVQEPEHGASSETVLTEAKQQLEQYFAGERSVFDLPLAPEGSDFQSKVWQALLTVPYGETCSYLDIAQQLGDSNAVRAVGAANGKNPLSIVVPCHRVIGKNGKLTGYAGGLSRKAWLLQLESGQNSAKQPSLWDE